MRRILAEAKSTRLLYGAAAQFGAEHAAYRLGHRARHADVDITLGI